MLAPVQFVDVLDGLLAPVGLDVDVDVGGLAALGGEEALEHQPVVDGVDRGDLQRVTDRGVGRRAAALAEDAARAAEAGDVPDHQEVAGEVQLLDDRKLVLDLPVCLVLVRGATEALGRARVGQLAQVGHLGVPGRHGERRQVRGDQGERECQLLTQPFSVLDRAGPAGEARRHLRTAAQVLAGPRGQPAVQLVQAGAGADRRHRRGERAARRRVIVRGGGGHDRQAGLICQRG